MKEEYIKDATRICLLPDYYIGDSFVSLQKLVNKLCDDFGVTPEKVSFEKIHNSRRYKGIMVVWADLKECAKVQNDIFETENIFKLLYD